MESRDWFQALARTRHSQSRISERNISESHAVSGVVADAEALRRSRRHTRICTPRTLSDSAYPAVRSCPSSLQGNRPSPPCCSCMEHRSQRDTLCATRISAVSLRTSPRAFRRRAGRRTGGLILHGANGSQKQSHFHENSGSEELFRALHRTNAVAAN